MHIGQLIADVVHRDKVNITWLAQEICCDRTHIYKIFKKKTIDTELLWRFSIVLQHDFFSDLSDIFRQN